MSKRKAPSRSTGKSRRALQSGSIYMSTAEEQTALPWRDRIGSDMTTSTAMTQHELTPVLICTPTHQVHSIPEDGTDAIDHWPPLLRAAGFEQVPDLENLDGVPVRVEWSIRLGRPVPHPVDSRFVTLTGAVRGPALPQQGIPERVLLYQGEINTNQQWIDRARDGNKVSIVTSSGRDESEWVWWAVTAHRART